MRYRTLGGTGIEVSAHGLGTLMFGGRGNTDPDDCARIVHAAFDGGINLIDTADMYSAGESERIVGRALRGRRDDVVLATKVHFPMGDGPNRSGNSRRWILRALEDSLRRLETEWIDLYQVHRPDPETDIEETLWVLTDLVREGKIRAFGCSTFPAEEIVEAHGVSERRGLQRFRSEQPPYSILTRGVETSVLPVCRRYGMGALTWSPLAWGFLSGKYRKGRDIDMTTGRPLMRPERFELSDPTTLAKLDAVEELVKLADEIGVSLPELAVAFPAAHPAVTSVIIGPRTMEHLAGMLKGARLALDDDVLDRIDEIVPPGTNIYNPDGSWAPESLTNPRLRRRPTPDRSAA